MILPAITTVAERALQRAIEEYRLQRPELVRTGFHSRSLERIAGQLEQEIAGEEAEEEAEAVRRKASRILAASMAQELDAIDERTQRLSQAESIEEVPIARN